MFYFIIYAAEAQFAKAQECSDASDQTLKDENEEILSNHCDTLEAASNVQKRKLDTIGAYCLSKYMQAILNICISKSWADSHSSAEDLQKTYCSAFRVETGSLYKPEERTFKAVASLLNSTEVKMDAIQDKIKSFELNDKLKVRSILYNAVVDKVRAIADKDISCDEGMKRDLTIALLHKLLVTRSAPNHLLFDIATDAGLFDLHVSVNSVKEAVKQFTASDNAEKLNMESYTEIFNHLEPIMKRLPIDEEVRN